MDTIAYVIINNIPKKYRSCDLRSFFSQMVETNGFRCFHFRHRPEIQKNGDAAEEGSASRERRETCCCVVMVRKDRLEELIQTYDKAFWLEENGETMLSRCRIRRMVVSKDPVDKDLTAKSDRATNHRVDTICESDIKEMKELRPPNALPAGNVGTPTRYILKQINECKFPAQLIAKLGLEFPRLRAKGVYGNVALNYGEVFSPRVMKKSCYGKDRMSKGKESLDCPDLSSIPEAEDLATFSRTVKGHIISGGRAAKRPNLGPQEDDNKGQEEDKEAEESDSDGGEEWDRHEAFHNDVTSQERSKERLFEEEQEVVWEKGGSGLVFYTDAQHWDEAAGDFDAKTSDDWDLDMSVYYGEGAGDKDARDFVSMKHFEALKGGKETRDDNRIGYFERFTKGIGRRLLEEKGWKEGRGVGVKEGMAEPIREDGQHPRDRSGFGYRGEKLDRSSRKNRKGDFDECKFSSVYDEKFRHEGHGSNGRSELPSILKYRQKFVKKS